MIFVDQFQVVALEYIYYQNEFEELKDGEDEKKQIDIYSDEIIAIEAIRIEVLNMKERIQQAESVYEANTQFIKANYDSIIKDSQELLYRQAKVDLLKKDQKDVQECFMRQMEVQRSLRGVLELFCH